MWDKLDLYFPQIVLRYRFPLIHVVLLTVLPFTFSIVPSFKIQISLALLISPSVKECLLERLSFPHLSGRVDDFVFALLCK